MKCDRCGLDIPEGEEVRHVIDAGQGQACLYAQITLLTSERDEAAEKAREGDTVLWERVADAESRAEKAEAKAKRRLGLLKWFRNRYAHGYRVASGDEAMVFLEEIDKRMAAELKGGGV